MEKEAERTFEAAEAHLRLGLVLEQEVTLLQLLAQLPVTSSQQIGRTHLLLARLYTRKSQFEKALYHAHCALQKEVDAAECHLVFSWICRASGQLSRAWDWLNLQSAPPTVERFLETGAVLRELGRFREAEKELLRALDLALQLGDLRSVQSVQCCHGLGVIYCALGRYNESRNFLKASIAAAADLCDQPNLLETEVWHDFAFLNLVSRRLVDAEVFASKALYARKKLLGQESLGLAKTYTLLGSVFVEEGKAARAERLLIKAITILRVNQRSDLDAASAFLCLAHLYLAQGELDHSLRNAERGIRLLRLNSSEQHADRGTALMLMAQILKRSGRPGDARACWDRMLKIYGVALPEEHKYLSAVLALDATFPAHPQPASEKWLKDLL